MRDGPRINGVTSIGEPLPRRNEPLPHQPERQDISNHHIEFDDRFRAAIFISDDDESEKDLEEEGLEEEGLEEEDLEENLEEESLEAEEQDSVQGQDHYVQPVLCATLAESTSKTAAAGSQFVAKPSPKAASATTAST